MTKQLNGYQIFVLRRLEELPLRYISVSICRDVWASTDNDATAETYDGWEQELVAEGYVSKRKFDPPVFMAFPRPHMQYESADMRIEPKGRKYLASLATPVKENAMPFIKSFPDNKDQINVREHLECLKGIWNGRKIMNDTDYNKLVEYTVYLIENNALPAQISKIPSTSISKNFLQETYYRLYKKYRESVDRDKFIKFLHKVFQQFDKCKKTTTSSKFSSYSGNYDSDKSLIK